MENKITEILNSHLYIDLGLERISEFLNLIGNPQDKLKYIHVAGTNGKGSVCAILNTILGKNGYKAGMFTSPHIFEYNERIQINGKKISDKDFEELIVFVSDFAEKNNIRLSEFEMLTVVMFMYFEKNKVDIVVLETGLGGRFDATNVIKENLCSVITHIDLEHTDRLGDTIDKISFEKAGIIKQNCPVVIGEKNKVIEEVAKERNSEVYFAQKSDKKCSLIGEHQKYNIGLALKVCEILNINVKDEDLMCVKNPCRFEYLKDYKVLVDVSHNPNSIEVLRKNLDKYYPNQNFDFIFGCLKTKDYKTMLKLLLKPEDKLYVYNFTNPNACDYEVLSEATKSKIYKFSDYQKSDNLTVICGSFYMLKELFNEMGIKYNTDSQNL